MIFNRNYQETSFAACRKILTLLFLLLSGSVFSATFTSKITGGPWATGSTWVGDVAPSATDDVIIVSGATVTVNVASVIAGVVIDAGGTLTISSLALTVNGSLTNNGTLNQGTGGLTISNGTWVNNGTYTYGTSSTVTFSATCIIDAGTGSAAFRHITIPSGAALTINTPVTTAGNLTISAPGTNAGSRVDVTGTHAITIGGNMSVGRPTSNTYSAVFNIGSGTLNVSGTLTLSATTGTRYSTIEIADGTVNLGAAAISGVACQFLFSGAGITNVSGTVSTGSPTIVPATGTVNFNGAANQNIWGSTYYNLNVSGNNTKSLNTATATINNLFTIDAGTTFNVASGTLAFAAADTYMVNNGTFQHATGTIAYVAAAGNQNVMNISYNNLTFSGAGTKTINVGNHLNISGNLIVNTGSTLSMPASTDITIGGTITGAGAIALTSGVLTVGGTWTHTGTFTAGSSLVHYNGSVSQALKTATYYDLQLSGTGIKSAGGTIAATNTLLVENGTEFNLGSRTLQLSGGGTPLTMNGTLTATSGLVQYSGIVPQNIAAIAYRALTFSGAGTKTFLGSASVTGTFTLGSPTTVPDGADITVTGSWANNATTTFAGAAGASVTSTVSGTGAFAMGSGTFTVSGNWTNSGTTSPGTSTVILNGAAQTLRGNFYNLQLAGTDVKSLASTTVISNLLTINADITLSLLTYTLNFSGTGSQLVNNGTLSIGTTSTVGFTSAGAQNVPGITYRNLTFSGAGTKTIEAGETINVELNWAVGSPVTMTSTANATIAGNMSGSGAVTMGSGTINVAGAVSHTGALSPGSGTFIYSGSANQTVRSITYYNLTFTGTGIKTISTATTVTVNNNWTVDSPTTMTTSASANVTGDISGGGAITMNTGTIALEGNWTNAGTFVPGSTGIVLYDGDNAQSVKGQDYTRLQFSGAGLKTLAANATVTSILTLNTGAAFNLSSHILTLSGSGTPITGAGTLEPATSTVIYSSAGLTTIAALNYYNLDAAGGARILPNGGIVGIGNTFTPGAGAYTVTNSTIHFNGVGPQIIPAFNYHNLDGTGGSRTLPDGATIGISGTFTPGSVTYDAVSGSTVNFNGSGPQVIPIFTFHKLLLSGTGTKTVLTGTAVSAYEVEIADGPELEIEGTAQFSVTQ